MLNYGSESAPSMEHWPKSPGNSRSLKFADFTLDLHAGELRRNESTVRLQDQPFQVLAILTQRAGEVVTRDELRNRLWGANTFVDFDNSLNAAVAKIREALADSPDDPRFVETLPRRGYRFIANVTPLQGPSLEGQTADTVIPVETPHGRSKWWAFAILGLAGVAIAALALALRTPQLPKVTRYVQLTNDGQPKARPVSFINILLTDDSRIYFALGTPKGWELAEVSATGGEPITVPLPLEGIIPNDISRDHSRLLFAGGGKGTELPGSPYWVMQLPGGPTERLGDVRARGASWSPDGKRIAYAQDRSVYIAESDGGEPRLLATFDSSPFQPRWSPDGTVLRFYLFDVKRGSGELWEISVDGTNPHVLFPNWSAGSDICCGVWTPDGRYFVFQATHDDVTDLWARRERASFLRSGPEEPVRITFGPMNFLSPTPSPDGKRLFVIGEQDRGELMRYDSASHQFVTYFSGASIEGLDFSPDGEWVLYTAFPEATLWRSRTDGSKRIQLSPPSWRAYNPRWSPDGKRVAFMAAKPGDPWKIYLIPSEGGSPKELIESKEIQWHPNWSAKGDTLMFGDPWWSRSPSIHLVDIASHHSSTLPNSEGLYFPCWSPNGRFVAAVSKDLRRVVLFDFNTQNWNELATMDSVGHLAWSRKGEYVYFDAATKDGVSIYRVGARDHKLERVSPIPQHIAAPFELFSPWTGLAQDDSPLLMRDASIQEIYALDLQLP